jgi:transcriptional regulator with XRE-family HTH domain
MRNPDELFGLEVQAQREEKGWSMTEFAGMLSEAGLTNFHPTTVGRLERGERPVRLSEAVVIAGVLGSKLDDLVVEPLSGDEDAKWTITAIEGVSKRAARYLHSVDSYRETLKGQLQVLESELAEGKILDEYVAGARETCLQGETLLESDRVKFWLDKLSAMSYEERNALYNADREFKI